MSDRHIFISHSSKDNAFVAQLASDLHAQGLKTWVDNDAIADGDRWIQNIQTGIEDCAAFIVVMSDVARKSEWVERETVMAMRLRKPVFIALIEPILLPLHLITRQYSDFRTDYGEGFKGLHTALKRKLRTSSGGTSTEPKPLPLTQQTDPNEQNYFAYIEQVEFGDDIALIARELYNFAQQNADTVEFGGSYTPIFHARVQLNDKRDVIVFSVLAYMRHPSIQVPLDYLSKYPPYTKEAQRLTVLEALSEFLPANTEFDKSRANRRPSIRLLDLLHSAEQLEKLQALLAEIIRNLKQ